MTVLIGPNTDAHSYEPSPAAAKALAKADLVIMNGLGLEVGSTGSSARPAIAVPS